MDTESVQFIGPTALIQYQLIGSSGTDLTEIILHDVMATPANETCDIIDTMMESELVGFNLAHDMFHLSRTYNLCKRLPHGYAPEEDLMHWHDLMQEEESRKYCLLPRKAVDLMIIGQRSEFQALIKQKPIRLRKVPRALADSLVTELSERIVLNPMYFAGFKDGERWRIKELYGPGTPKAGQELGNLSEESRESVEVDPDFVNLELPFQPKKTLKSIMKHILKYDVVEFDSYADKTTEYFWNPNSDNWMEVYDSWMRMWRDDPSQRKYARDDIVYTRALYEHFYSNTSEAGDDTEDFGSVLACMAGNLFWKGYSINPEVTRREYSKAQKIVEVSKKLVNFNSPPKTLEYILAGTNNPIIKNTILSTDKETLERLYKADLKRSKKTPDILSVSERAKFVLDGRHADKRATLLRRLLIAGKLYCQFKISGTATNRKAGGSMEGKGESINPQGIPSEDDFREMFTFMPPLLDSEKAEGLPGWAMSGGDAESFEVSIAAAVFNDPGLTEELLSKRKFHAIFGSFIYKKSYDEILATDSLEGLLNLYKRAKAGVFAWFYGGLAHTISEATGVEIEQVEAGLAEMEKKYPGIGQARLRIWSKFEALRQKVQFGAVEWHEPDKKITTFLGFERSFEVEVECCRTIFQLANKLPDYMKEMGKKIKVMRNEEKGEQTGFGATMSSLFAAAFQITAQIMRIASNFVIQSPGGEMIKKLEYEIINKFQPRGIHSYYVIPFNQHDEEVVAHRCGLEDSLEELIYDFVERYKKHVPLFSIKWRKNKRNWKETH